MNKQQGPTYSTGNYIQSPGINYISLIAQLVKNPPAMQETLVQFLGEEDPLEKGKAWPLWPGEFRGLYSPWGHKESDMTERFHLGINYNGKNLLKKEGVYVYKESLCCTAEIHTTL